MARGRFAGWRFRAIRRIFASPIARLMELFPENESLIWLKMAEDADAVPGIAVAHLLARAWRAASGRVAFNQLVASGEVKAPIVIGRDHLDAGSVACPYRETEAMRDGSDAIGDWPILNALTNALRARPGFRFITAEASASAIPHAGMVDRRSTARGCGEAPGAGALKRSSDGCHASCRRGL